MLFKEMYGSTWRYIVSIFNLHFKIQYQFDRVIFLSMYNYNHIYKIYQNTTKAK